MIPELNKESSLGLVVDLDPCRRYVDLCSNAGLSACNKVSRSALFLIDPTVYSIDAPCELHESNTMIARSEKNQELQQSEQETSNKT